MIEVIEYEPCYEPWYVFIDNEGFRGFDSPYGKEGACHSYPDNILKTYLAVEDGLPVGFIDITGWISVPGYQGLPEAVEINTVAVLPPFRGRGVGSALLHHAEGWIRVKEYPKAYAYIIGDARPELHRFYIRRGYKLDALMVDYTIKGKKSSATWENYQSTVFNHPHQVCGLGFVYRLDFPHSGK